MRTHSVLALTTNSCFTPNGARCTLPTRVSNIIIIANFVLIFHNHLQVVVGLKYTENASSLSSSHHHHRWRHPYVSSSWSNIFTARKRSLGQVNIFTGVFLSTGGYIWSGGAWSWGVPGPGEKGVWSWGGCLIPGGKCLILGRCLVPGGLVGPPPDGYCCGQYVSYWNAFLSKQVFSLVSLDQGLGRCDNPV